MRARIGGYLNCAYCTHVNTTVNPWCAYHDLDPFPLQQRLRDSVCEHFESTGTAPFPELLKVLDA